MEEFNLDPDGIPTEITGPKDLENLENTLFQLFSPFIVCPKSWCDATDSYDFHQLVSSKRNRGLKKYSFKCDNCHNVAEINELFKLQIDPGPQIAQLIDFASAFVPVSIPGSRMETDDTVELGPLEILTDLHNESTPTEERLKKAIQFIQQLNERIEAMEEKYKSSKDFQHNIREKTQTKRTVHPLDDIDEPTRTEKEIFAKDFPLLNPATPYHKKKMSNKNAIKLSVNATFAQITKAQLVVQNDPEHKKKISVTANKAQIMNMFKNDAEVAPVKFFRLYVRVSLRSAAKFTDFRTHINWVRMWLKELNLYGKIKDFSWIGKSILELYVPEPTLSEVKQTFKTEHINVVHDFDPMTMDPNGRSAMEQREKIVNRLSFLYSRHHLAKMKEAIIAGYPETIRNEIINKAMKSYAI